MCVLVRPLWLVKSAHSLPSLPLNSFRFENGTPPPQRGSFFGASTNRSTLAPVTFFFPRFWEGFYFIFFIVGSFSPPLSLLPLL